MAMSQGHAPGVTETHLSLESASWLSASSAGGGACRTSRAWTGTRQSRTSSPLLAPVNSERLILDLL